MNNTKEELIKDTAKTIFFKEGNLHATTQEIADAAGVNRALINYYFRSRDLLFKTVYDEAVKEMRSHLDEVIYSERPFKEKLAEFIEAYMVEIMKYPYKESFLITEICSKNFLLKEKKKSAALIDFVRQIEAEMGKGNIERCDPNQFLISLFSLMAYPIIMAPLYRKLFDISKDKYATLISERKELIFKMIYK